VHGSEFKSALDKFGKPYESAIYSNEAHGLNLDANVFDFYNHVDHFLAKHLHASAAPEVVMDGHVKTATPP
jgi:dipeptidyl aminopeptidase/acylaminoacyl peptidase